jgi:hypothetical protein
LPNLIALAVSLRALHIFTRHKFWVAAAKRQAEHWRKRLRTHCHKILVIAILALLSALPLRANDSNLDNHNNNDLVLPDAPSASPKQDASQSVSQATPAPSRHSYQGPPPTTKGGAFGVNGGVADGKYLGLTGGMFGSTVANAELTQRCLSEKTCTFFPSSLSSRAAMYGIGLPADFAVAYVSYRLKRNHNRFWIVPEAALTGANIFVAAHSWSRLK